MTHEEKIKALSNALQVKCNCECCVDCNFFEPEDDTDGDYFCGIRDNTKKVPWKKGWNVKEALGLDEHKPSPFP